MSEISAIEIALEGDGYSNVLCCQLLKHDSYANLVGKEKIMIVLKNIFFLLFIYASI